MLTNLAQTDLEAHLEVLRRVACASCGPCEEAEDLVQETCVRVLAHPRQVDATRVRAYLLRALRNTQIDLRRAANCRPRSATARDAAARITPCGGPAADAQLEAHGILDAIRALPGDQRGAVTAIDLLGLGYLEAAHQLGIPIGTLTSRLARGRDRVSLRVQGPPDEVERPSRAGLNRMMS